MPDSLLLQLPNTFRAFYGSFASLYKIQRDVAAPILSGCDLVLQSATGSGKSEAVLAPSLERVIKSNRKTAVLYIIPTRALAMDLKRRFESVITKRLMLNLAIRTGDIKRTGGMHPDIMFTTPESLDVMIGSTNADLKEFLFRVQTVIIDEVHPLIYQYRGRHLAYLFTRLERRMGRVLQKIAMSATIAHVDAIIDFFGFSINTERIITSVKRDIAARLLHIKKEESELPVLLDDLYDTWQYRKILIFVNSRAACDRLFGILNRNGKFQGVSELHYSNLKPPERKMAEKKFRRRSHALCIATSTLELGIDVGDVDAVLLYEPPCSVSAFLQRIGRANRREKQINFWGLCCGENSGDQVVRFLALLELSRKGIIESPTAKTLPSVLSQQVISCLYEKRRVTLLSLQSLFPAQHEMLPSLFESLEKKRWLKKTKLHDLLSGGWQYYNHLFDYKIWGNFPETEDEYILEVSEKSIADIPQSIVSQMEVGDRVYIAGRQLRILKIDTGELKKVMAKYSAGRNEKQLAWIGMGPHISYEVTKAMGDILKTGKIEDKSCLFARTKKLFLRELKQGEKKVVLENGIEVVSGRKASFRYRTFIGSAGNLMLEWSIRENLKDDDLFITSDEIGLECSHWISFEDTKLPLDYAGFQSWVKKHLKILRSLIPLNLFCKTLPKELLIQELTDFLFDRRIACIFAHYHKTTSKIISGDKADIFLDTPVQEDTEPCAIDIIPGASLLEMEKEKSKQNQDRKALDFLHTVFCKEQYRQPCLNINKAAALTATMVSDYFFYAQCQRRFCFKFLGIDSLILSHDKFKTLSMNLGIFHEKQVQKELKEQGNSFISMESAESQDLRFKTFLEQLNILIPKVISHNINKTKPVFLSQCLLKIDDLWSVDLDHKDLNQKDLDEKDLNQKDLNRGSLNMNGIGIPDLLVLSVKEINGIKKAVIEVGDIKSSMSPRFHHKWQVAFYAWLLKKIINLHDIPAVVAETGFLFTRSFEKSRQYEKHRFDLKAYFAAFPMLFKTIQSFLSQPVSAAGHKLQSHCVFCDWYLACYYNALENEDIQFLPGLTTGELLKLRKMGCAGIAQTHAALEKISSDDQKNYRAEDAEGMRTDFTLEQQKQISGRCTAFLENRIYLIKKQTRLFPSNISKVFFIHLIKDPLTGLPSTLGLQVTDSNDPLGMPIKSHVWIMGNDQEQREVWQEFISLLSSLWEKSISNGKVPHIFHFGLSSRLDTLQWGEIMQGKKPVFLWQTQPSSWTDLKRVFKAHFYMPAPGVVSLFALGYLFGCNAKIDHYETLFHNHAADSVKSTESEILELKSMVKSSLLIMVELYAKACFYLESQWIMEWDANMGKDPRVLPYIRFIKEEQRLQENDILTLQELTIHERMLRFRAVGYLNFVYTRLNHEGRFLYILKTSKKTCPSKFRKGDFLKLTPHGISDIQNGFPVIIVEYDIEAGEISLLSRSGKMNLSKKLLYSIEEDISDWNQTKLIHAASTLFTKNQPHFLQQLLAGQSLGQQPRESLSWLKKWLTINNTGLNSYQQSALALPFQYRTSIIQGPPGTGKTHLLGWMLIALIMQAHEEKRPLRIGVSALTHQAIDTVLKKVTSLVNQYFPDVFPGHCIKWGQPRQSEKTDADEKSSKGMEVEFQDDADDILSRSLLILGATGYGFYNLFNSKNREFPLSLDWIIFDEASQILVPHALLSLIYSKGNFLFLGDVNQLPPIVLGDYGEYLKEPAELFLNQSIMANFLEIYPKSHQETLNITYRMNKEICAFPGKTWYKKMLYPAPANAHARLTLKKPLHNITINPELACQYDKILDPAKPVVLILTNHHGCSQQSDMEAEIMAALAGRLITGYGLTADQMALISPHRAQNNLIIKKLGANMSEDQELPLVDTVERVQGAERDIIIFGITTSDPDHLLSEFLNSPNRLNVAMTRAKTKLIVIGSNAFFSIIPDSESILEQNSCFKQLLTHCQKQNTVFYFDASTFSNSFLSTKQTGHYQSSGRSSKLVP